MTDETNSLKANNEATPSEPLTREELYKIVWSAPMLKVGKRFKVSSSYMVRVCKRLNVPRPERGYWNKLAVGKASPIAPLPDIRPVDEPAWVREGQNSSTKRPLPRPPFGATKRKTQPTITSSNQHPLVKGAKELFAIGRLSNNVGYLKPNKKLLPDLIVSKTGLDKALTFANQLFLTFEEYGYSVVLAPKGTQLYRADVDEREVLRKNQNRYNDLWHPWRATIVYIGTVAIGLTIIETSEEVQVRYVNGKYIRESDYMQPKRGRYGDDHTWTTTKEYPTGGLCLQAYSPYPDTGWNKRWQETIDSDLNKKIKNIIHELEQAAEKIAILVEQAEHRAEIRRKEWEAQQETWRIEEDKRKAANALKESRMELLQIIDTWNEVNRIDQFFLDAERRAEVLEEDEKSKILERLKEARRLIGNKDALKRFMSWRTPDERLGKISITSS